jgi:hypothetical protein
VPEGFPTGVYTSDGARWALRVGGGLTRRRQNRFEEFTPEQTGFPADRLEQIATAPDGSAWAAYENGSLLAIRWTRLAALYR